MKIERNGKLHREGDMPAVVDGEIHKWYKMVKYIGKVTFHPLW
jgi:hypothetical protein